MSAFPSYDQFRTGLTFAAVRDELANEQRMKRLAGGYMFVTYHTVMGRWHQHKLAMYAAARREWRREQLRRLRDTWRGQRGALVRIFEGMAPAADRVAA